ncbi:hypothetical protein FS749_015508 [Ceratobasidium sp. UAMH 11750]|nr:hypothetical protein FS749_015508 [Ceratobasidium sp. UAMH 11750]
MQVRLSLDHTSSQANEQTNQPTHHSIYDTTKPHTPPPSLATERKRLQKTVSNGFAPVVEHTLPPLQLAFPKTRCGLALHARMPFPMAHIRIVHTRPLASSKPPSAIVGNLLPQ